MDQVLTEKIESKLFGRFIKMRVSHHCWMRSGWESVDSINFGLISMIDGLTISFQAVVRR